MKITVITTKGCSHCEEAKKILNKLIKQYKFTLEEIDASSDKGIELIQKHNILSSPGILINDKFFSMGGITESQIKNKLEELTRS